MKLILKTDLENLGEQGDVVDVKPGYARNYLLPRGLAYEASAANLERIEKERKEAHELARRDYLEARRRASQLEDQVIVFTENAGEEGKLFGSVTSADIAERLNEQGGLDFEVDRRTVLLEEPLKTVGVSNVEIKLHGDVIVEVEVRVERGEG
jgi:large subunit ribosomal protein L9